MTTQRLYYHDATTTAFSAEIVETTTVNNQPAAILDQTLFYPTSGGQPHDTGTLNGVAVVDVFVRPDDEAIVHVLEQPLEVGSAEAQIDWSRRFDHMQHHTGQHILSQAFLQVADAATVGFHLSENSVTIDLDKANLSDSAVGQAQALTNDIIWQNRPIHVRMVSEAESAELPLRKRPPAHNGQLRLIDIADFDLTACGGTHVAQTGGVGLLKISKVEKRGDKTRISFLCGKRALADYDLKHSVLTDLSTKLTTGIDALDPAIDKLQQENKQLRRSQASLQETLLAYQADDIRQHARMMGDIRVMAHVLEQGNPKQLRTLANLLLADGRAIALLGLSAERSHLFFARADDTPGDMSALLKVSLAELESSAGGGRDHAAQGSATPRSTAEIEQAILVAVSKLVEEIETIG